MNILPKKSWHVRNKDNIARVRRDEENARLEDEKRAKRAALAEQEARTKLLRDRVHDGHGSLVDVPSGSREDQRSSILPYNEPQTRHINFFAELESGTAVIQATNNEYEAEKKAEKEKMEKAIGVLKYLGQSTIEGEAPWYLKKEPKDDKSMSTKQSSTDSDRKNKLDPLRKMNKFLEETKKSESEKKEKKKKEKRRHSEGSRKGKKTIEELRAERLQREKEERCRAEKLIKESKEGKTDRLVEDEDPYRGSYYSQYNPDLARKPKWNSRYQPY